MTNAPAVPVTLIDDPLPVAVADVPPHQPLLVHHVLHDHQRRPWSATVQARANGDGVLDLTQGLPDERWPNGIDPYAGLWSARCDVDPNARLSDSLLGQVDALRLTVTIQTPEGATLLSRDVPRAFVGPDVQRHSVRADGVVGELFVPQHGERRPLGVLVLGGAWGWFSWSLEVAALLASRGHPALAAAFFDWGAREGLPCTLSEVPLECLEQALDALADHPVVKVAERAVVGISKGAEAALLLAARRPDVRRVVALSPSSHVWESVRMDPDAVASSWSAGGGPLPYLQFDAPEAFYRTLDKRLLLDGHELALAAASTAQARIPVERIAADTLLVSLTGDVVWPSRPMADAIAADMRRAGRASVRHLTLPAAGHGLFAPGVPANGVDGDVGDAARADHVAWRETLEHLV